MKNRPYVKQYDAEGELMNPIDGYRPGKGTNEAFPAGFPNREERRRVLNKKDRAYSNKKGVQLIVTRIGNYMFSKYTKVFQNVKNKRIVHYVESR